jgi:hypothetical protein
MRLAQIVLPDASQYERKSQRIDEAALRGKHELVDAAAAEVTHVYGREAHVTAGAIYPRWIWWKRAKKIIVSPIGETPLPEAVEDAYFEYRCTEGRVSSDTRRIGSFARQSTKNLVEQTAARLQRFRSDVEWNLFDHAPLPAELAALDAWVDPAIDEKDFDGFVAEALVVGLPVVASRTPINVRRLEEGRTGMLVPPRDPNEMTHAILAVLFKQEVAASKQNSARQTVSKYRARQRLRVLAQLYDSLNS